MRERGRARERKGPPPPPHARMVMPLEPSSCSTSSYVSVRRAFAREEALPAPWHVLPKVSSMPLSVPVSTKLQVPMVPPMSTGCPVNW
jgi:hypothetical protein